MNRTKNSNRILRLRVLVLYCSSRTRCLVISIWIDLHTQRHKYGRENTVGQGMMSVRVRRWMDKNGARPRFESLSLRGRWRIATFEMPVALLSDLESRNLSGTKTATMPGSALDGQPTNSRGTYTHVRTPVSTHKSGRFAFQIRVTDAPRGRLVPTRGIAKSKRAFRAYYSVLPTALEKRRSYLPGDNFNLFVDDEIYFATFKPT